MPRAKRPPPPTDDKRWKLVDVAMSRSGYSASSLIEVLHKVQDCFGYLDNTSMTYVARCLGLPLSKVFGVSTFYHLFTLRPVGEHTCVVCTGTACYIKGSDRLLESLAGRYRVGPGETTTDRRLSIMQARCLGACGLAPAVVIDRSVLGKETPERLMRELEDVLR